MNTAKHDTWVQFGRKMHLLLLPALLAMQLMLAVPLANSSPRFPGTEHSKLTTPVPCSLWSDWPLLCVGL